MKLWDKKIGKIILRNSLWLKAIFVFCSAVLFILALISAINIYYQRSLLEKLAFNYAAQLGQVILTAMRNPMLNGDQDIIQKQFNEYSKLPAVAMIHLTDKNGFIRRSTDLSLIGQIPISDTLKDSLTGKPYLKIEKRKRTGRWTIIEHIPIFNEKSCYPCHGREDKVLGVVRIGLDWESVLKQVKQSRNINIILSTLGVFILSFSILIFFKRIILYPIDRLIDGMRRVKSGDFSGRLKIVHYDEIGLATEYFNTMTEELKNLLQKEKQRKEELERYNFLLQLEIEERRRIEKELMKSKQDIANIIDFLPDPTFVIDSNRKVIFWNKAMEQFTGILAKDIIGKGDYEYALPFYGERRPILVDLLLDPTIEAENFYPRLTAIENKLTVEVFVPKLNNNHGAYVWAIASPLYDLDGTIVGAIETVRDITAIKNTEEALKKAYEELKRVQNQLIQAAKMASLGTLAGGVAHEINNPLTGVLNNVQLIKMLAQEKKDFNINEFKELLAIIEESAQRCVKITRALLDFSHASKGRKIPVNINEQVEKVVAIIAHDLRLENIIIEKELALDVPALLGDEQLIQQVLFDILSNARWAIKKKNTGNGTIKIKTSYDRQKKEIIWEISDTGIGIPAENIERIFEPFFTTKEIGEGTGLGLSLVYSIIKDLGGDISVSSNVGEGTCFRIRLPVIEQGNNVLTTSG
ncbi:MAG: ATP-binding protein [Candidatus Omnitrophica bacterium]|nr:ATP-binding protein [Candidatus Omnitrophota bacterium]